MPIRASSYRLRTRRIHRHGVVLLTTVAILALATMLLAIIARQSLRLALDAVSAEEDLQRRWGTISCRRALLDRVEMILRQDEQPRPQDVRRVRFASSQRHAIQLGELTFELILADEEAKLNVNSAYAIASPLKAEEAITNLLPRTSDFRPRRQANGPRGPVKRIDAWGEVLELPTVATTDSALVVSATSDLTCWGSGRLNVQRASDRCLEEAAQLVVGRRDAAKLVELRREQPDGPPAAWLSQLALGDRELADLQDQLQVGSRCF